jgi:AmmeMemoRadiSam system protein B
MARIRQPAVAGLFYPADASSLAQWLTMHLCHDPLEYYPPQMLLLPHAGYNYSGQLAALGICQLPAHHYRRVIILSPAHKVALNNCVALPAEDCEAFATPLGEVKLDREALTYLAGKPGVISSEQAHQKEHSVEVQLPLLQQQIGDFLLLPLIVSRCPPKTLMSLLLPLLDKETLLIVSSDLSHFMGRQEAQDMDCLTLAQIMALEPQLTPEQACGYEAINFALHLAAKRAWRPRLLGQYNSGEITGEHLSVVGYASVAFYH